MTVFIPGELYKTKADVPVYLLNGNELTGSQKKLGVSYWQPGIKKLAKTTLPADIYVMCLSIKEIEDRRGTSSPKSYSSRSSSSSDLIQTVPDTPSAIKNTKKSKQPVFELTFLYQNTMYVFVCSGHDTIRSVSDLFFERVTNL